MLPVYDRYPAFDQLAGRSCNAKLVSEEDVLQLGPNCIREGYRNLQLNT